MVLCISECQHQHQRQKQKFKVKNKNNLRGLRPLLIWSKTKSSEHKRSRSNVKEN